MYRKKGFPERHFAETTNCWKETWRPEKEVVLKPRGIKKDGGMERSDDSGGQRGAYWRRGGGAFPFGVIDNGVDC